MRVSKNRKKVLENNDLTKIYTLNEASDLVKKITTTKFDASVDIAVDLNVDPRKADQMVRGSVILPHGLGKDVKVLVLCTPDKENEAKEAGADFVGLDEYVDKIKGGWYGMDVVIATPNVMGKIGMLGKVLGPRGLMPNPRTGTVTMEVGKAVNDFKSGKLDFKVDKFGVVHASIGRVSFEPTKLYENAKELVNTIISLKPSSSKGKYMKSISMSSTMSPGISVEI